MGHGSERCDVDRDDFSGADDDSSSSSFLDEEPSFNKLLRAFVLGATALGSLCNMYTTFLSAADNTTAAIETVALVFSHSRRVYCQPRRVFSPSWWTSVVLHFRAVDERRFVRNFRIPSIVMDEEVAAAEVNPAFTVSSRVSGRVDSTSKKVHMVIWRLGRPATVADCSELFGVSEGFVSKWTVIVLRFIKDVFGHRLWGRK